MKRLTSYLGRVGAMLALLALPMLAQAQGSARVQVVHNSADPSVQVIDVYLIVPGFGVTDVIQDLEFRTARPFTTYTWPIGGGTLPVTLGFAPGNSTGVADTLFSRSITFNNLDTAVVVATGDVGAGFQVVKMLNAREVSTVPTELQVATFHGVSDAPAVDVLALNGASIGASVTGGSFSFGQFGSAGYVGLSNDAFVGVSAAPGSILARYFVPSSALIGEAGVVMASGYLAGNPDFGLYYAPASGGAFVKLSGAILAQFIHNSPDPFYGTIDVYDNNSGALLIDDFTFRTATPFVNVVGGGDIGIAPGSSTSSADAFTFVTLPDDNTQTYYMMAVGVQDPTQFAANPNSLNTEFGFVQIADANLSANAGEVNLVVAHGSTDAPAVDVNSFAGLLVNGAQYKQATSTITVPADDYLLLVQVTGVPKPAVINDATSSATIVGLTAPLAGAGGGARFVFASGFATPANNQNGPSLAFFAASPDGSVGQLAPGGLMQLIHNSPDPAVDTVDVYLDGNLAANDFSFRKATPYMWVNSVVNTDIDIAPGNSTSVSEATVNLDQVFNPGVPTVNIVAGVTNPGAFAPNPGGASTALNMFTTSPTRIRPLSTDSVEFVVFHGATDAPNVDVEETFTWNATLVTDLGYGEFTNYLANPTGAGSSNPQGKYTINLYPTGTTDLFRRYSNVNGGTPLPNVAAVLFVSGFADPSANGNGAPFALFGALAPGIVLPLTDATPQSLNEEFASQVSFFNAYPNPAQDRLTVEVDLRNAANVSLSIVDVQGRVAQRVELGNQPAGLTTLPVDVSSLAPGLYAYTLNVGNGQANGKLLIQR